MPGDCAGGQPQPTSLPPSTGMTQPVVEVRCTTAAITACATSSRLHHALQRCGRGNLLHHRRRAARHERGVPPRAGGDGQHADLGSPIHAPTTNAMVSSAALRSANRRCCCRCRRSRRLTIYFTITASPDRFINGTNARIVRKRTTHIGGEDRIDQFVGQRFQVGMRDHPGETGGVHQHVAAAVFPLDDGGGFPGSAGFPASGCGVRGGPVPGRALTTALRLFRLAVENR